MRRLFGLTVIMAATAAVVVATATAGSPDPSGPATGRGHALGMVPTWAASMAMPWANGAYRATYGSGQLMYHGGPVMQTNTTYAIYWNPSNWGQALPTNYDTLVNQYFGDVAADSGSSTNVYDAATQYSGIQYSSSFGGKITVNDALPQSGCTDSATSVCLTDAQLQAEITTAINRAGWTRTSTSQFFLFTAPGVGSCADSGHCAYSYYCAYHGSFDSGSGTTIYANQPYVEGVSGCDAGHHPNSYPGDAVLNVVSHEHNEAITDPFGNAWYDRRGYENGDKCAWSWGSPTGSGTTAYNQTIHNHHYMLQLEYSNASRGCVMTGT